MGHPVGFKLFLYDVYVYDMVCIIIYVFCIEKTLSIEDFHLFPFIMNVKGTRFREKKQVGPRRFPRGLYSNQFMAFLCTYLENDRFLGENVSSPTILKVKSVLIFFACFFQF